MKYIRQLEIILSVSFAGEVLHAVLPLPVPASIYGIVLMFTCLETGLFKTDQIREASSFLLEIMPLMFIAPAVGLVESWDELGPALPAFIAAMLVSTFVVIVVSGGTAQWLIRHDRRKERT